MELSAVPDNQQMLSYRHVILKMAFVREGALMSDEMREHVSHLISIVVLAVRGRRSGWMVASVNSKRAVWKLKERRRDSGGDCGCDGIFGNTFSWNLKLSATPSTPAAAIQFVVFCCVRFSMVLVLLVELPLRVTIHHFTTHCRLKSLSVEGKCLQSVAGPKSSTARSR